MGALGASSVYIIIITSRHTVGPGGDGSQPAVKRQVSNLGQGCAVCEVRHRCDCCCLRDAHASDRAAGLPKGRSGMARQHSVVVCISARPRRKRWASDTGEVRSMMMRGLGWATGEAREVTKMAYCSFYRGAAGEGDKGAMLACPRGECWTELHVGILRVAV